jgi:hypothetical protein
MFEMRLTKPKAIGWVTIAKTLNAEGLRSPTGGLWGGGTIRQIVTNTAYIGLWSMGDRKGLKEGGRRTMVPGDDPVLIKVPGHLRIVPQELWDAVQEVTANDPQAGRMNAGRPVHALAGVIRCAECGGALSTAYGRKKHRFYSCSRRRRSGACDAKGTIPADRLEAAIIIEAAKILDLFAGALQHALHSRADVAAITKRPDVSKVAAELKAAQDRLRKARKIAYASDDESEETISHLKQLGEDVKRLELSQAAATAEVQTAADFEQETLTLLANMRSALQAEPLAARATLNAMFPRGLALAITPDTYRITGVPRIGDSTPRLDPSGSNRGVLSLNLSIPRRAA